MARKQQRSGFFAAALTLILTGTAATQTGPVVLALPGNTRALALGMALVIVAYLLVNVAYLAVLGHAGLAASTAPAADVM